VTSAEGVIPEEEARPAGPRRSGAAAMLVSGSIFVSKAFGLVRQMLMAQYLGASLQADAFTAAFKITNYLQNLFGEGAMSSSFIPVYSRLLEHGEDAEADRVAGAVASLLVLAVAVLVLIGVVATPALIPLIAPGFTGERRELTIRLTRILFPGAGVFVISAWCLGVLNSHRKFLLPYLAPVLWNVVMIGALLVAGPRQTATDLAAILAWASVAGATLQFLVQVPTTLSLIGHLRLAPELQSPHVRRVLTNFSPILVSRGVVQISNYIDNWLASFLPKGMVATFGYASTIVLLPVSLFGMAVSAAELPEMSRARGTEAEIAARLRDSLGRGLRMIAYFAVPSAAAFLAFGDVIARILLERGKFTAADSRYTWGILAGAAVGLLASTLGRLYSAAYYALHDTRTPLRFAIVRVVLTTVLGYIFALRLPGMLGIDSHWGASGLTVSAGIAGWVEFALLRGKLNERIGQTGVPAGLIVRLWASAALGVAVGWALRRLLTGNFTARPSLLGAVAILLAYGITFLAMTFALRIPEARTAITRVTRRFR
jgi:integral membrane protein MviN